MKSSELISRYPVLFPDGQCLCGISIGRGWLPIVDSLCFKLANKSKPPVIEQIKQKFGMLCVYVRNESEGVFVLINEAASLCSTTCEDCGAPGVLRSGVWIRVLCDDCSVENPEHKKQPYVQCSDEQAKKFGDLARKWLSETPTGKGFWNLEAVLAVAEYLANQKGYTRYEIKRQG